MFRHLKLTIAAIEDYTSTEATSDCDVELTGSIEVAAWRDSPRLSLVVL